MGKVILPGRFFLLPLFLLLSTASLYSAQTSALLLEDFEDDSWQQRWSTSGSVSTQYVAHGKKSLRLDLSDSRSRSIESVAGNSFPRDWSAYEKLRFDIYNPSGTVQIGSIQIFDELGSDEDAELHGQSYRGGKIFMNRGWNHYEFLLQKAMVEEGNRPLALDKIRRFRLSFGRMSGAIYLDNIRLTQAEEQPQSASATNPRNCRVVIDNRFVFPSLYGPEEDIKPSAELVALRLRADKSIARLETQVQAAELMGYQTLYWKTPLIAARIGLEIRSKLVWYQDEIRQKATLEHIITSCNSTRAELEKIISARDPERVELPEDEVNPHLLYVPDYPVLRGLTQKDGYFRDELGDP
ncbi:MAG: hypothetical protein IID15_07520, partial [Candidatus Marinimicrobia bacterium]|nr:hypothetical protein [Candidatus Neomarinimicrobiota bacterium]